MGVADQIVASRFSSIDLSNKALEDLKKAVDGQFISLETSTGKKFDFTYHGRTTFRINPEESKPEDLANGYPTSIKQSYKFLFDRG
ncbi:hypothetical protein [Vibrio anguillarum]|uniref:hypothetical protein n=1 Tax=Vibrio anguillarum TaxID=55601 RepID=UPI0003F8273B|nr:hypothetical protein [Vibrio anguillarum]